MKRGVWHQCGDKSQRVVEEQLRQGNGVGAIISPRDLAEHKAIEYAQRYRQLGADVLIDTQFYVPSFSNTNLASYQLSEHRASVSDLHKISDADLSRFSDQLEELSRKMQVTAVVAPAVIYETGRDDITELNRRLFGAAQRVGDRLGLPTIGTVVLGRSVTASMQTIGPMISTITRLNANGWYFGYEFAANRIPSDQNEVERAGQAMMMLASSGAPVIHAYAGPMAVLSFGFGASAAAIGHPQNTWQFLPERWHPPTGQGGGGDAPPRFFSGSLWGTIIFPDEVVQLRKDIAEKVLTHSPFSNPVQQNPPQDWSRWDANKHLLYVIGQEVTRIAASNDAAVCANEAKKILASAVGLHAEIFKTGITLGDSTSAYQAHWLAAVDGVKAACKNDYDYLRMLSP